SISLQMTATGHFSDGTVQDVTASVDWRSSDDTRLGVSAAGLASALEVGSASVIAECMGVEGSTQVTVTSATLTQIEVTPGTPYVADGLTLQFTATGVFSDASRLDLSTQVAWDSSDPARATVSNAAGSQGLASAQDPGPTTIRASLGAVTGATVLTVTDAQLVAIQVDPPNPTVADGLTMQFTAVGRFTDNSNQDLTGHVFWASSNPAAATVSPQGLASALDPGQSDISATLGPVSGSTRLTVSAAELLSIQVTPVNPSLADGLSRQMTATGTFTDGARDITDQVTWTSSNLAVATISNAQGSRGSALAVDPGQCDLEAALGAVSGSTRLTVTAAQLTSIDVSPMNPSLPAGLSRQFTATGRFTDNSSQDLTAQVTWSSSDPAAATVSNAVGQEGLCATVAPGQTDVGAALGAVAGTSRLTVTGAQLTSIQVTPLNPSLPDGLTRQLTATGNYSDGSNHDITQNVTWTSDNETAATVSNAAGSRGLATAVDSGVANLAAVLGGISGSTRMRVTPAELASIQVLPANASTLVGLGLDYTAVGVYTDNSTYDMTAQVWWQSSDPAGAPIESGGHVTALAPGQVTITAVDGPISGSTSLTITSDTVLSVVVTPTDPTVIAGRTVQFRADAFLSNGSQIDATPLAFWTADNTSLVYPEPASGLFRGIWPGQTTVRATLLGIEGSTRVTVTDPVPESIQVLPEDVRIGKTDVVQYSASGTYSDGSRRDITDSVLWETLDNQVAVISNQTGSWGRLTGVGAGTTTVRASLGGVSGSTTVVNSGAESVWFLTYRSLRSQGPAGVAGLTTGDLDADGNADLVYGDTNLTPNLTVRLGLGGGNFLPPVVYQGEGATDCVLADINEDGRPDVATVGTEIRVRLGNGDGTLGALLPAVPRRGEHLLTADFNRDGHADLAALSYLNQRVSILYGNGTGASWLVVDLPVGQDCKDVVSADFNQDGDDDLALLDRASLSVQVFENTGTSFSLAQTLPVDSGSWHLGVGEWTGDSYPDLAVNTGTSQILLHAGSSGGLQAPTPVDVGAVAACIASADMDRDGSQELLVSYISVGIYILTRGQAGFGLPVGYSTDYGVTGILPVHLDQDGRMDLVAQGGSISLLLQNDPREACRTFRPAGGPGAADPQRRTVGDLNEDGRADVVHSGSLGTSLSLGQADGTFTTGTVVHSATRAATLLSDLNRDGHLDLLLGTSSNLHLLLGNGDGSFQPPLNYPGERHQALVAGDVNGDALPDIV
ncbi:MAG: Ig-like domain-containing protein, partial [Candidatus Eremiobacterota bacterium]